MIEQTIRLLADESIDVAKAAGKIITCFGRSGAALELLYSNPMLNVLHVVLNVTDEIRFRVYETLINICKLSIVALECTVQSGLIQQLLNEMNKDDILIRLNCLELISDLAMVDHGLVYLDQQGIVQKLETMMASVESDPMASFLVPGLMKFFGGVARYHPKEICSGNSTFVNTVFENLSSSDQNLCSIAIQTVGFIGSSIEGKLALDKLGNKMKQGLQYIGKAIRDAPSSMRLHALHTTASLIKLEVQDQTTEFLEMTENWFSLLNSKSFDIIMGIAQQPFTDLRISAHEVLTSLAMQSWGQKLMNNYPGFNEYLLDRSTEKVKEGKDSKFEIIKVLADSPTTVEEFGQPYYVKLKAYVLAGPYFVQTQSEVAFEGD